jgi:amino acid permease
MFGLGTLTLPADFVRLGWIPALALVILFAIGDIYSGLLYTRLLVALPDVVVFDQIGERAMGKLGKGLVYGSIYLTILAEPVIFHLTCVEALKQVRCLSSCRGCHHA